MSVERTDSGELRNAAVHGSSLSSVGHEFVSFRNRLRLDSDVELPVAQRMIDRLEELDAGGPDLPATEAGKAALACSIVAHAVVELEELYLRSAS